MDAEGFQRDMARAVDDAPIDFDWNGLTYVGTRGALVKVQRVMDGGILVEPDAVLTTSLKKINSSGSLVSRFPNSTKPAIGEKVRNLDGVSGQDFRIDRTHEDEFGAVLQMDLVTVNK